MQQATMTQSPTSYADGKILYAHDDGIASIRFNNPEKHNAMSVEMWEGLGQALVAARDDERTRVLVLAGEGGKAFVSGADISQFDSMRSTPEEREAYARRAGAWRTLLPRFQWPTISSIRGYCIGGGLGLALSTDIRIASTKSQFGIPAAKLNIPYPFDGLRNLSQLVGPSWAKLLMFSAMRIDADRAERIGLITERVDDDQLEARTLEIARTIAANAPLSVRSAKLCIDEGMKDAEKRDMQAIADIARRCTESEDTVEGRRAFMEKRPPKFTGR